MWLLAQVNKFCFMALTLDAIKRSERLSKFDYFLIHTSTKKNFTKSTKNTLKVNF